MGLAGIEAAAWRAEAAGRRPALAVPWCLRQAAAVGAAISSQLAGGNRAPGGAEEGGRRAQQPHLSAGATFDDAMVRLGVATL